jgi:hypothetical protein
MNNKPQANNLFLLGAGFTRAVFPEAPLNEDLFHEIVLAYPKTKLNLYSKKYGSEDIEILLTRLDLEIAELQSEKLRKDRENINRDLAEYFQRFRFGRKRPENNNWLEPFAREVFHANDAIITTNYDCFLEGLLDHYQVWHPKEGYINVHDPSWCANSPERLKNPKGIKFYKIHGSEHFKECKVFDEEKGETEQTIIGFTIDESIFPVSGKQSNLGWVEKFSKEYIIAPSFVKIPHELIERMMINALETAGSVKNLVIIGCGLRKEDSFLWLLLTNFLNQPIRNNRKLIIVDPCAEGVKNKIRDPFFVDINNFINIKLLSSNLESVIEQLINELHNNN